MGFGVLVIGFVQEEMVEVEHLDRVVEKALEEERIEWVEEREVVVSVLAEEKELGVGWFEFELELVDLEIKDVIGVETEWMGEIVQVVETALVDILVLPLERVWEVVVELVVVTEVV